MAYFHTVTVVRAGGKRVRFYFKPSDALTHGHRPVTDLLLKAIKWPATLRVEVEEEDTQLYAYPADKRHYPRAVLLKDGRIFEYLGHGDNQARLYDGHVHAFHID